MWGLGKLASALLAATSSYAPNSVQQIDSDFKSLYTVLGDQGAVYKQMSPTIKFSHVTPPKEDQDWKDVLNDDAHIMDSTNDNIFQEIAKKHGSEKPIALYLPGLDGFGISAATWQFNDLARTFDLWRMTVKIDDRSSFSELVKAVTTFVTDLSESTGRPVYVIGESFGGLLAPAVTLNLQKRAERNNKSENPIQGLVMVNPATSFDRSAWDVLAPVLSTLGFLTEGRTMPFGLPSPYAVVGGLTLSALIPSSEQFQQILDLMQEAIPTNDPSRLGTSLQGMLDMFKNTEESLPPGLLAHRIKNWMIVGSDLVQPRLGQIDVPTFVIVGNDDNLIDSGEEVKRLEKVLNKYEKLVVRGAGHFVLDADVNLTEAIVYSNLDPLERKSKRKKFDPILDWELPPQEQIEETRESSIKPLEDAFSPVYMSTDENGTRSMGLHNLPQSTTDRPLLFVSNHQLCKHSNTTDLCIHFSSLTSFSLTNVSLTVGLDLNLLISKLLENDVVVRGLAHPVVFQGGSQSDELGGRTPGLRPKTTGSRGPDTSNFRKFGAVMVTPRNYYRVLQSGQNALLFPGGVREVFHGRDEAYQLFWVRRVWNQETLERLCNLDPSNFLHVACTFLCSQRRLTLSGPQLDSMRQ